MLLAGFLLLGEFSYGQMIKEFHRSRDEYLLDITTVLEYSSNRSYVKQGEELLEAFSGYWESG